MKIVCESCGAKYSIADEKVAGRTFKIRCKRCSAPIVVHGEAVAAASDAGAGVAAGVANAAGGDPSPAAPDPNAVWHAVVQGEQQGPMTQQALEGLVKAGTLDGDGYVWREGFDGWLPVRDVPELAGMLSGGAPAPSPSPAAPDPVAGGGAAAAENADGGNPAYAGAAFGAADTGTPLASRATRDDGADLFAPADPAANPFAARAGGDDASADDDVIASAPSNPRPTGASNPNLTGQRNENSVLFSLQNLQALATGPGGCGGGAAPAAAGSGTASPAPARAPAPLATGGGLAEGSGLIDIRALASATSALGGTPDKEQDAKKVDDLLSIGGAGPGLGASSLGTPVLAPAAEPEKNNKATLALAVLGGFVVLAAAIVAGAYIFKPEPAIVQAPATTTGTQPAGQGDPPNTAAAPDDGEQDKDEAAAGDAAEDGERGEEADAKDGDKDGRGSRSGRRSRGRTDSDGARTGSSSGGRSGGGSGGRRGNDIDSLLEGALGGGRGGSKTAKAAPAEDLPEIPNREQAMRALRSVEGAVKACADGQHGVAMTQVTVSGSNGRVSRAVVQGQFAGTPQGSCVARAVRRARFPRFTRSTFQVTFPYRL